MDTHGHGTDDLAPSPGHVPVHLVRTGRTIGQMSGARPGETEAERLDRNFNELLQELRVGQTGVQILFAFLLTMPLQARFRTLDDWERGMLVAALLLAAVSTACMVAPVAYHRILFRQQKKKEVVEAANRFARAGLTFLLLAICASLQLVLDLIVGRVTSLVLAGAIGVVLVLFWLVMPLRARLRETSLER